MGKKLKLNTWYKDENFIVHQSLFYVAGIENKNYIVYEFLYFYDEVDGNDRLDIYLVPFNEDDNVIYTCNEYTLSGKDFFDIIDVIFTEKLTSYI